MHRQARALSLALLLPTLAGCGHAVTPRLAFDQAPRFDFRDPPCRAGRRPAAVGPDDVVVRYLGAGGLYVEWRGVGLLTGPFFSNPDLLAAGIGRVRTRRVGAILVGHSHYDHLGDVAFVARRFARGARIYVNRSGATFLAEEPALDGRVEDFQPATPGDDPPGGIRLHDASGRPLPFRLHALPSSHAPHVGPIHLMKGETKARRPRPDGRPRRPRRLRSLKEGLPHAFVIDLLDPEDPEAPPLFRIHYQDAASDARKSANGIPPEALRTPPIDLAVVCMASADLVHGYPERLVEAVTPRHVLVTHYEDFFRPREAPSRFVVLLTPRKASRFLERTDRALHGGGQILSRPQLPVCGATSAGWTMPRVGEWMVFRRSMKESEIAVAEPR